MPTIKIIPLQNGGETIVDEQDYEWVARERWFKSSSGYAYRQGWKDGKHWEIWLHREINRTPPRLFTDHINGNKLDNRKSNLRTATKAQNAANSFKLKRLKRTSELKGVYFHKASNFWCAKIQSNGKVKVTYHKTQERAALDYNRMATEQFGEYARLNVLPSGIEPTQHRPKSSKYRGVTFHKKSGWWRAATEIDGKSVFLGQSRNEKEAAQKYNEGVIRLRGADAKLNRIED